MTHLPQPLTDLSQIDLFFPERGLLTGVNTPPTRLAFIGALGMVNAATDAGQTVAVSGNTIYLLAGDPDPFGPAEVVHTFSVDDRLPEHTVWEIRTSPERRHPAEGSVIALASSVAQAETLMQAHLNGPGGLRLPGNGEANWDQDGKTLVFRYQDGLQSWEDTRRPPEYRYYRLSKLQIGVLL